MIRKYRYGAPFDTEALTEKIETAEEAFPYGEISQKDGFAFTYIMDEFYCRERQNYFWTVF